MFNLKDNVSDISRNYYKYLLSLKNVNGVGCGYKYVNGICTNEFCIHVFVENKIPIKYLSKSNIIPKTYMGINTDVIELGVLKELGNYDYDPFSKIRPLQGGYLISAGESVGTLGCIVSSYFDFSGDSDSDSDYEGEGEIPEAPPREKYYFILSNNHVITANQTLPVGSPIYQPASPDYKNDHIIARLTTYVPLQAMEDDFGPANLMDCAIAKIINPSNISNKIGGLGKIKGIDDPNLGDFVQKAGAFTGVTSGAVLSMNVTEKVQKANGKIYLYQNQNIAFLHAEPGDSGSVIINDDDKVIGLAFAGGTTDIGVQKLAFTKIKDVLNTLGLEVYF